jgi:hypothetical protein
VSNLCKHIVEFHLLASMRSLAKETAIMTQYDIPYRRVKIKRAKTAAFIPIKGCEGLATFRAQHGNRDIEISMPYEAADLNSMRTRGTDPARRLIDGQGQPYR